MDLRTEKMEFRSKMKSVSFNELSRAYINLCEELNKEYKLEKEQTVYEDIFHRVLKGITKLEILRSCWIGKRNCDLFIPAVKACNQDELLGNDKVFRGLVIEIDGEVHNEYQKMRRDESKYNQLHELGIATIPIENHDFDNPVVKSVLSSVPRLQRLDFRAKKRLLRNIYLYTLRAHKDLIIEKQIQPALNILKILGEAE